MPAILPLIEQVHHHDDPLAIAARRISLLAQDPEGYAKACTALANFTDKLDIASIKAEMLVLTSLEGRPLWDAYNNARSGIVGVKHISDVNMDDWHGFGDLSKVAQLVGDRLQ
jgi:hypothetical protein